MDRTTGSASLDERLGRIAPADGSAAEAAWHRWDSLCKPLRGLGALEEDVVRIAAMQRTAAPSIDRRAVVIMGADNGVVAEGVSQTGSEVTRQVLENMGSQISSVCIMSRLIGAEVIPVDIGMNTPADHPRVLSRAVRRGTGNIARGRAMTREECVRAVETGIETARQLRREGYNLLIAGEMGIGNTTTSAACACALFGTRPEETAGRGAGLSEEGLARKIGAVARALEINAPDPQDPLDICSKVGGLDIAGMTGLYLGGALENMPVLIDGGISGIAACLAVMLHPAAKDYMIATHCSSEPYGEMIFRRLGLTPVLYAGMHLGEGTGAAAFLPLLDQALALYRGLPSFEDANVEPYKHLV